MDADPQHILATQQESLGHQLMSDIMSFAMQSILQLRVVLRALRSVVSVDSPAVNATEEKEVRRDQDGTLDRMMDRGSSG